VLFVADEPDRPATGKLLLPATKILSIHSADGQTQFEVGKDVELSPDGWELVRLEGSRIPRLDAADLFPPAGAPRTIPHKTEDPQRHVLFDNAHWFHDQQVEVTYAHDPAEWPATTPEFAGEQLPHVLAKLRAGEPVTIGMSGDSISAGGNASGVTKTSPWMPAFPELVAAQLQQHFKSDITLHNRAVGGWVAPQGAGDLDALLAEKPDLVVIAYGMNDVSYRNADAFKQTIAGMLDRIRQANAETDVILVSPMTGHAEWVHTPPEMFTLYRDALASLTGPGVALADVTALWKEMLGRKREVDLTGNGVNHPNDFGHRVYAQAVLALLVEPPAAK
jgi:acyl-CoA thioesterase I